MIINRCTLSLLSVVSISFLSAVVWGQNMNVVTANGTVSYSLTDLESVVFRNGIFVVKDQQCGDHYYSDFFTTELNFGASESGLSELNDNGWSLFPNPTSYYLQLTNSSETSGQGVIVDITGAIVQVFDFEGLSTTLNVSQLNKGIYFIQIQQQSIKFLKQ